MIYYTAYAKVRMAFRDITHKMVESALIKPDRVGMGYNGKSLVFKKFSRGLIKIVFVRKKSSCVVISAIWEFIKKN
ncbi:hypothetical protein A2737_01250 [Candidatus Nomurabacteria bacterium RIFCSPHIGHO2_01_FULL_41_71]|nr:MAG: hypothetical protein A2737_01250 [Candidatus Nomurabacteria bacterium RIFCSPHIGHO2_01_FULL_41_71]